MAKLVPVDYDPFGNSPGKTESAIRGALQGATANFSDEIQGGIGAALARLLRPDLFEDQSFSDTYKEGRDIVRAEDKAAYEANPWSYGGGAVAGSIVTGSKIPFAATRPARLAQFGGIGALSGYGGSEATTKQGQMYDAAIGGALGLAGGYVGEKLGDVVSSKNVAKLIKDESGLPTIDDVKFSAQDIKDKASMLYKQAEDVGGILKPEVTAKFVSSIEEMQPQTNIGRDFLGDSQSSNAIGILKKYESKPMTLREAEELDQILGDKIDDFFIDGRLKAEGKKLLDIQSKLRQSIDSAIDNPEKSFIGGVSEGFETVKEARKLWSANARMRDIERMVQKAELSNGNSTQALRTSFKNLLTNPTKIRGYSDEERKLIKKVAEGGPVSDLLGVMGSKLNAIIAGGAGAGPGATAATYAAGAAARGARDAIQFGKAQNVSDEIARAAMGAEAAPSLVSPVTEEIIRGTSAISGASLAGGKGATKVTPEPVIANESKLTPVDYDPFASTSPQSSNQDPVFDRVLQAESGNRDYDAQGNIIRGQQTRYGRAEGAAQVLPMTQADPGYGVTPARDKSPEELRRVGRDYFDAMKQKYNQNLALALMAYNWGPSNTDQWLASGANPNDVPVETRKYIAKILRSS